MAEPCFPFGKVVLVRCAAFPDDNADAFLDEGLAQLVECRRDALPGFVGKLAHARVLSCKNPGIIGVDGDNQAVRHAVLGELEYIVHGTPGRSDVAGDHHVAAGVVAPALADDIKAALLVVADFLERILAVNIACIVPPFPLMSAQAGFVHQFEDKGIVAVLEGLCHLFPDPGQEIDGLGP